MKLIGGVIAMTAMEVVEIPLGEIQAPEHLCQGNGAEETSLQKSISRHDGLLQPIVVRKNTHGFKLLAGFMRYQEAKRSNWETIPAVIYPKDQMTPLEEFMVFADANLKVSSNTMDLAERLRHGKALYVQEHEETKPGITGGKPKQGERPRTKDELSKNGKPAAERYTKVMAEKLGVGESTVKNLVRLADKLPENEKKQLRHGKLKLSEALKLLPREREKAPEGPPEVEVLGEEKLLEAIGNLESLLSGIGELSAECEQRLIALAAKIDEVLRGALPVCTENGSIRLDSKAVPQNSAAVKTE